MKQERSCRLTEILPCLLCRFVLHCIEPRNDRIPQSRIAIWTRFQSLLVGRIQVLYHFTQIIKYTVKRITFSRDGMKTLWKVYILNLQDLSSLFLICKCISSNYLEKCILSNYLEKWSCKSEREGRGWSNSLRSNSIPRARQALKRTIRPMQAGKVYILFISSARFEFQHCFDFDFLMKSIEFGLIWKHFFGKPSNKSRDKMRIIKNTKAGIFNFSFTFCQS